MKDIWSKAPEGFDIHISWGDGHAYFYRESGDRFTRENDHYAKKSDLAEMPEVVVTRRAWSGAGLPPVGVECEFKSVGHHDEPEFKWCIFRGKTQFGGYIIEHYQRPEAPITTADAFDPALTYFRPIRTAEQIAAEEREKAIDDIAKILDSLWSSEREAAGFLYDAGYRKQVQP